MTDEFTHVTDEGDIDMVDIGDKPDSARYATARGSIDLQPSTITAIESNAVEKGNVLSTARIGAIQAVKHTWETIPLCHHIPITNIDTDFDIKETHITLTVHVATTGKTGAEMEALQGVVTGLTVVWDMVKAAEKDEDGQYPDTRIHDVTVVAKEKRPLD